MPRKTKLSRIKRRQTNAFVDEGPSENTTAICNKCYENDTNVETILVTYPRDPIHFLQCPDCHAIVNRTHAKHRSIQGILGNIEGMSSPSFSVVETRRRSNIRKTGEEPFDPTDYPMTLDNQPDGDLAYYNTVGQIVRIVDDDVGEQEFD